MGKTSAGGGPAASGYPSVTAAGTITLPTGSNTFLVTGNTTITSITAAPAGTEAILIFSGTPTVTDGSNLKLNGNFVATADDALTLSSDGTNWYERSRSAN